MPLSTPCAITHTMPEDGARRRDDRAARMIPLGWFAVGLFPFAAFALVVAGLYSPAEIAADAHLVDLHLPISTCPGCLMCGLSRAFAACMRMEFAAAFAFNPLVFLFWPTSVAITLFAPVFGLRQLRRAP